jgi:hypothetical protein
MAILIIAGCATASGVRVMNRENLLRLSIGMTKQEVLNTMGTKTFEIYGDGVDTKINNPYRSEIIPDEGKNLEVLYYYTDVKQTDGAVTDDELTPLVLDQGKLIGWGWSFLHDNVKKYELRMR